MSDQQQLTEQQAETIVSLFDQVLDLIRTKKRQGHSEKEILERIDQALKEID